MTSVTTRIAATPFPTSVIVRHGSTHEQGKNKELSGASHESHSNACYSHDK